MWIRCENLGVLAIRDVAAAGPIGRSMARRQSHRAGNFCGERPHATISVQRKPKVMSTDDIIQEAQALPANERAIVVDSLLRSLNPPDPEIDTQWMAVARERLAELRSGDVQGVPGEEVFARLEKRFPPK